MEIAGDKECFLGGGQGATKGAAGEGNAKIRKGFGGVGVFGSDAGEVLEVVGDVLRRFDSGVGRGFVPCAGDVGAAFVASGAVIGGEGGVDDESFVVLGG